MSFVAGTSIATIAGYRSIETIVVGDLVYTHTGRVSPVIEVHRARRTGDMMSIELRHVPGTMTCHPDTLFMCRERTSSSSSQLPMMGLRVDGVQVPPVGFDTVDDWWLMGIYVACGWIASEFDGECVYITLPTRVGGTHDNRIRKAMGHGVTVCEARRGSHDSLTYRTTCDDMCLSLARLGHRDSTRRLPRFVHLAPRRLLAALLDGIALGNGCDNGDDRGDYYRRCTTSCRTLALDVQRLHGKLGSVARIVFDPCHLLYSVDMSSRSNGNGAQQSFLDDDVDDDYGGVLMWHGIRSVYREWVDDVPLFGLTVQTDGSYIVNSVACHGARDLTPGLSHVTNRSSADYTWITGREMCTP